MLHSGLLNSSGMVVSVAVHLTALTIGLAWAGVRPFETTAVEAISVDIVSAAEVKKAETPQPAPVATPDLSASEQPTPAAAAFVEQPAPTAPTPAPPQAKPADVQPQPADPPLKPQPAAWLPPEPDITVKYQVNLGLPARTGQDFDSAAFAAAKVATDDIARFRQRLKTCSVLPESIAPTDRVTIRLRANFLPDGRLASVPLLIEASASAKGPALMRAAIHALESCQPYAALPPENYSEWKVLDLSFTPQDFRRG
jgi:hypothetical protein